MFLIIISLPARTNGYSARRANKNSKTKKMKKNLLLSSILLGAMAVNAQPWVPQATGFATASRGIRNVVAVDAQNVWVSAYDGTGGNANTQDYSRTTDGGTTWTPGVVTTPSSANYNWSNLWAISATTAWGCLYDATGASGGGIFKTTDGGTTWAQQGVGAMFNNTGSFADIVYFWDANNGIAIGDPAGPGTSFYEIYTTSNGGGTWTRTATGSIPAKKDASEYGIVNLYSVQGNTFWFGTNEGRVYKSTDKGMTWTVSVVSSAAGDGLADIDFRSANEGLAVVYNATSTTYSTYSSLDGGASWGPLTPSSGSFFTADLAHVPGTSAYVSTGAATGMVGSSFSVDDGNTWVTIDSIDQHTAQGWVNSQVGWCGGFNTDPTTKGIFMYTGPALGVPALTRDNARMRLFPNPSSGQFTMQIAGAESKDAVVTVVDIVGSVVYQGTVENSAKTIEKHFDLTGISKGVYFVNVENGSTRFSSKITIK